MTTTPRVLPLLFVLALSVAARAGAEPIVLAPRHEPGDRYLLSLSASTRTETTSTGWEHKHSGEHVRLDYEATVVVLQVDEMGRPLRERHQDVGLTYLRPGDSAALFGPGTTYEVQRTRDGEIRIFVAGRRIPRPIESILVPLLGTRFGATLGPALFDPGRPVSVGESWELEPALARRFLEARGVDVIELNGPATATLARDPSERPTGKLVIRYRIPVSWCELDAMPPNASVARSEALLEGEIRFSPDVRGEPVEHAASLSLHLGGVVNKRGVAPAFPWELDSTQHSTERVRVLRRSVASRY